MAHTRAAAPDVTIPKLSLLEETLAAARRDPQFVTPKGEVVRRLTAGVTIRALTTHVDDRGSLCELFDPRWGWHPDPLIFAYTFSIRPGVATLSGRRRCAVNVPINVWHADHNIGDTDVVALNFPTKPYQHTNPDKYRLPLDTPLIPYSFGDAKGY